MTGKEHTMKDQKERLLVVDDEQDMLSGIARILAKAVPGLEVDTAASAEMALALLSRKTFTAALVDIQMPDMDGLALLDRIQADCPELTVIIMTAYGTFETAVDAMRRGAYDFIAKPFDRDVLVRLVGNVLERNRLVRDNKVLQRRIEKQAVNARFVGASAVMQHFLDNLKTIAKTDYTVLIRGESGTGKELAARALHDLSRRNDGPLIAVNCPAVPESLLESELFGHKKGAFTGADRDHRGLFDEADGGTICLDEIGDIPVSIQTKLLRVLQEGEIKPLGASVAHHVNVRVIAVTNQDLEMKMAEKSFREDFFYRLNVVTLWTPPLRRIPEDIPLLVAYFASQVCQELKTCDKIFAPETITELKRRPWPGNVRELQNMVRRAVLFSPEKIITPAQLDTPADREINRQFPVAMETALHTISTTLAPYKEAKEHLVRSFEETYVKNLLERTAGNVSQAAELSGLTRAALQKIMKRQEIQSRNFR